MCLQYAEMIYCRNLLESVFWALVLFLLQITFQCFLWKLTCPAIIKENLTENEAYKCIVHQSALKRIQWNKNNGTGGGNSSISFKAVFKAKGKRNLYRISTNNYAPFAFPFSCPWFFHLSRGQFLNSSAKMKNAWNYQNFPATSDFVKLFNKEFFLIQKIKNQP